MSHVVEPIVVYGERWSAQVFAQGVEQDKGHAGMHERYDAELRGWEESLK